MALPADDGAFRFRVLLTLLLGAIGAAGATDLWLDLPHAPGLLHIVLEATVLAFSLGAVGYLWWSWMRTRRALARSCELSERHQEARDAWRARAEKMLRGLGEEIDAQLRRWSLTPAEREVALLLLKGYGHKEIAVLLERSERTVRQHAVAVYRKSGLSGRAELSAFFLEDLLLPPRDAEPASPPPEEPGALPSRPPVDPRVSKPARGGR